MRRVALVVALLLAGCADSANVHAAKEAAAAKFAYPGGAQFQRVREVAFDGVCGEVNGRMLDGQMTGFRRFYWAPKLGVVVEAMKPASGVLEVDRALAQVDDSTITAQCQ